MLNQTEEKIIEALLDAGQGKEYFCALDDIWKNEEDTTVSQLSEKLGISEGQIKNAALELERKGYVIYRYSEKDFSAPYKAAFALTNKGLSYREEKQRREEEERRRAEEETRRSQESEDFHEIAETLKKQVNEAEAEAKSAKCWARISQVVSIIGVLVALAALVLDHIPPAA